MVRAILDGRKTQTRKRVTVHWHKGKRCAPYEPYYIKGNEGELLIRDDYGDYHRMDSTPGPYGPVGSLLWVRETCHAQHLPISGLDGVAYKADGAFLGIEKTEESAKAWMSMRHYRGRSKWDHRGNTVPSIHMPRWASRITLEVTALRVERLQSITANDARAEGFDGDKAPQFPFSVAWDSIYKSKGYGWDNNPWVWAYEFKVAETRKRVGPTISPTPAKWRHKE
jgi:hypothetical protein